jgi:polysaccharide biosynthesis transport protein
VPNEPESNELNLMAYWARVRARRWWVLSALALGWILATATGYLIPPKYRSETVILIEQQQVPEHYVQANVAVDLQQRLQSMSEQILSRTRLLMVIDKLRLYGRERANLDPDSLVQRMRKDISIDLVRASGRNDVSAFKVSYSASSALLAQQVTGELTSAFIEENLRTRERMSVSTTEFLESQLSQARTALGEQEEKLRKFKSEYLGQLPEQVQGNIQILSGLQARLQASRDALNSAEQQRLYLESLLGQYRATAVRSDSSGNLVPANDVDSRLEQQKAQLAELSAKYTPQHPDIVMLKEKIAATEKLKEEADKAKAAAKTDESATPKATPLNPTTAQFESQLKANQLEIANRKKEIHDLEGQMEQYQARLNVAPVREQQLAAITRDHEQSKQYYESLLAKKLQSEMATNLERRQQGEQFRMIDPPSLPARPYFPNRLVLSLAGCAVGLAVGVGLVVLLERMEPTVYLVDELRDLTNAPVLAELPLLMTDSERRRGRLRLISETIGAAAILTIIPAVTMLTFLRG